MAEGHLTEEQVREYIASSEPRSVTPLGRARHIFTHIEWHMTGYLVECQKAAPEYPWVTKEAMEAEYSIPTAFKFYKKQLQNL
jgi:A/G-specific adenine glycosylase